MFDDVNQEFLKWAWSKFINNAMISGLLIRKKNRLNSRVRGEFRSLSNIYHGAFLKN